MNDRRRLVGWLLVGAAMFAVVRFVADLLDPPRFLSNADFLDQLRYGAGNFSFGYPALLPLGAVAVAGQSLTQRLRAWSVAVEIVLGSILVAGFALAMTESDPLHLGYGRVSNGSAFAAGIFVALAGLVVAVNAKPRPVEQTPDLDTDAL